jgi:hypothetical protein
MTGGENYVPDRVKRKINERWAKHISSGLNIRKYVYKNKSPKIHFISLLLNWCISFYITVRKISSITILCFFNNKNLPQSKLNIFFAHEYIGFIVEKRLLFSLLCKTNYKLIS